MDLFGPMEDLEARSAGVSLGFLPLFSTFLSTREFVPTVSGPPLDGGSLT